MVTKGTKRYIVREGNLLEGLLLRTQVNNRRVTGISADTLQDVMRTLVEILGMIG